MVFSRFSGTKEEPEEVEARLGVWSMDTAMVLKVEGELFQPAQALSRRETPRLSAQDVGMRQWPCGECALFLCRNVAQRAWVLETAWCRRGCLKGRERNGGV
jgi:hypothetical protein